MKRNIGSFVLLGALLFCLFGPARFNALGAVNVAVTLSSLPDGTNYNLFLVVSSYMTVDGDDFAVSGPLLSITNLSESLSFQAVIDNSYLQIYSSEIIVPPDFYGTKTYTLTWTNYATTIEFTVLPVFVTHPASQSVFVGTDVIFTAQAVHTSGYQWQKNGTNLVEGSRIVGVTNSTLTISNAQTEDEGNYTLIATHPTDPASSGGATLSVFKPIQLDLVKSPSGGSFQLQVNNKDSSPMDNDEVSHFAIYSTTDMSLDISGWNIETNTGMIQNGIYKVPFQDNSSPARFWQVGQQP